MNIVRVVGKTLDHYPQKGPEMTVVGKKKGHYPQENGDGNFFVIFGH